MNGLHRYLLAGFAGTMGVGALAQTPDAVFERSFDVDEPIELDVASGPGSVTVRQGATGSATVRGELTIHGDRGGGWAFWQRRTRLTTAEIEELTQQFESAPPVELSAGVLKVGHIEDEWSRGFSVDYEVVVPAQTDVRAVTGAGLVSIEGIDGEVEARSGSGRVSLRDIGGAVLARTGSGSIEAEGIAGSFNGESGSGSIDAALALEGDVSVATGSGRIALAGVDGALTARAGSGSITIDGRPAGAWALNSGSGPVLLRLPSDSAFRLEVRTGSGGISTSHPLTVQGDIDRHRLDGDVRGGGPLISVRTGSGGVRIE